MTYDFNQEKLSFVKRSDDKIPSGGWRGGEEIPPGGWRAADEIPFGGLRGGEEIPPGGWRAADEIPFGGWRGGEEIPPGGWRAVRDVYRTKDGRAYFTFDFVEKGIFSQHYEIDIVDQPSYGSRSTDVHVTHRLRSDRGGYRVCLGDDSQANSLYNARKWAGVWAEHTWKYIETGRAFPNS